MASDRILKPVRLVRRPHAAVRRQRRAAIRSSAPFVDYQGDPVYAGSEDHWSNVLARARGGPHPAGITAKER